jgi:hypothetical protein
MDTEPVSATRTMMMSTISPPHQNLQGNSKARIVLLCSRQAPHRHVNRASMKRYGSQPCSHDTVDRASRNRSVLTLAFSLLAYVFLYTSFAGSTFIRPTDASGVEFTALRANIHLAARNDSRHLRDADRDNEKGGAPPDNSPFIVMDVFAAKGPFKLETPFHLPQSTLIRAFYRATHQPRAPPLLYS